MLMAYAGGGGEGRGSSLFCISKREGHHFFTFDKVGHVFL